LDRPSLCEHLELLNGAYAQYIAIPAHIVRQNLYPIPDVLSFEHAAILEPLSCTLHGIERSEIRVGDTVGIVGVGPIGLMLIRLAKLKGARVIAVGRNTRKLTVAQQMGADEVLNIQDVADPVTAVKALTPEGRGVDVAIEAVGLPEVWQKAFEVSRKGALVNLFGGCSKGTTFELDTHQLHYEERKVIGVFHHTPYHVATALKLLADGLFDPTPLITHRMPLADLPEAFRRIEAREALKVAIFPNDA
jgi:L-iditol 2-dehydrogenase